MERFKIEEIKKYQVQLLDMMWECETPNDLFEFRSSLTPSMQKEVDTLVTLVHLSQIDYEVDQMSRFPVVEKLLAKIKNDRS